MIRSGLGKQKITLYELRYRPMPLRFLIARMLYQDDVNGVLILGGAFAAGMFGSATKARRSKQQPVRFG